MSAEPPDEPKKPDPAAQSHGILDSILKLASITFGGDATAGRIVFFAVALIGMICAFMVPFFALNDKPDHALICFVLLVSVVAVLLCRMAWRLDAQPPTRALDPVLMKERDDARTERDTARAERETARAERDASRRERDEARTERNTARAEVDAAAAELVQARAVIDNEIKKEQQTRTELVRAREGLDRETQRANALAKLTQDYEVNVAAISTHYQKAANRFPKLLSYEMTVTIKPNGDAEVVERRKFKAVGNAPQSFLIDEFRGTLSLDSFLDLNLRMKVHSDHTVAWLPVGLNATPQEVLFVFLPPLKASDAPLDFSILWSGPGAYRDLLDEAKRKDFGGLTVHSADTVPVVRLIFRIHEAIKPIKLSKRGNVDGTATDHGRDPQANEFRVYQWESLNVTDGGKVAVWLDWV